MKRSRRGGFTLLEVLVATLIMGIAISGLLYALAGTLRNAGRLNQYDRSALLARQKMDELILNEHLPRHQLLQGGFDPVMAAGMQGGWRAQITPWEAPPGSGPGTPILDRVELEIWWMNGEQRRSMRLEGFRKAPLRVGEPLPPPQGIIQP